jgi:3-deoxy-D-manno-octulosonic-acid transferase
VSLPLRFIYSCIFYLITPLLLLKLWRRGAKAPAYRQRISERFGFPSKTSDSKPLWIHAVSVGETVAIAPVLKKLIAQHPHLPILITTSTPTGADRVATLFADFPQVWHQYCPYDQPTAVAKFITKHRPLGLLIVETELWPNMLAQCKHKQIPVILANARMSEKSARGYHKLASLTQGMLSQLDLLIAQYESDAQRFVKLGLTREKLRVSGSIKFDADEDPLLEEQTTILREQIGSRPVIILGSSHESEEQGVLELMEALWEQYPDLLLIIVPRHPERFDHVAQLASNYSSHVGRRSQGASFEDLKIYIGDTMGELKLLYSVADLAIVGGSFVPLGGQSPIEPASLGKGVLMGPQQFNFSVICPELEKAEALQSCDDFSQLAQHLSELLGSPAKMREMGSKAQQYCIAQQGATQVLLDEIDNVLLVGNSSHSL